MVDEVGVKIRQEGQDVMNRREGPSCSTYSMTELLSVATTVAAPSRESSIGKRHQLLPKRHEVFDK